MQRIKNKKIFIAPYSPISRRLGDFLKKHYNVEIIGFIDREVIGQNIYKVEKIPGLKFDYILIFSPNHFNEIYNYYKSIIPVDKLFIVDQIKNKYVLFDKKEIIKLQTKEKIAKFFTNVKKYLLKNIPIILDKLNYKRETTVFIAKDYIDANIKHLFLYFYKQNKKIILLTDNEEQQKIFNENNLPATHLSTLEGYLHITFSKTVILDHFVLGFLDYLSPKQTSVQLWHGVGLKPIRDRSGVTYDYFISPSNWTNESNFKKVFKAKHFLNLGYPRNDILFSKSESNLDLLLCDMDIYNDVKKNKQNNIKNVLYMPTYRENSFESFPIKFSSLDKEIEKLNIKLYIKLHPFIIGKYFDSLDTSEVYNNIIFYNTQGDIYPILKYVDILITDYSSIAYDFLLLDRPIIFFNYDYDEYIAIRGNRNNNQFLFNYYEHTPGAKVQTQEELISEIKKLLDGNDIYKDDRLEMKNKFFDPSQQNSCKKIFDLLESN
jgi:CDP-glycerol glycerophosphotransferase (TagB/SpsB family)